MSHAPFIHLRVHTAFSLAEGAIRIPKLIEFCKTHKMPAVAMTDTTNVFGSKELSNYAPDAGIQPIIGCQIKIEKEILDKKEFELKGGIKPEPEELVLLVQNETGYLNLSEIISRAHVQTPNGETPQVTLDDVRENNEGLLALTAGYKGAVGQLILDKKVDRAEKKLLEYKEIFGDRLYIELMRHETEQEDIVEPVFIDFAYKHNIPMVATNEAFFIEEDMFEAHDALICIAEKTYVEELDRKRLNPNYRLKTPDEMVELFSDIPEAIENTLNIAKRCGHKLEFVAPLLPPYGKFETVEERKKGEEKILREKSNVGLQERLEVHVFTKDMTQEEKDKIAKPYWERLEYELGIIVQMGFPGYFLIVMDFIQWSKAHDVPVGPGRGSGAGSVVAWALTITDLDPLRFGLLFERFLNPERVSMPDFDVDFCQEFREKTIEYVQEKYGKDKVAQIITFGKLQAKAVVRDVGRVLQMPYSQVDRISKMVPAPPGKQVSLKDAIDLTKELRDERDNDENVARMLDIGMKLEGLYRHASTHAAGLVIGDRHLPELVPLYKDPNSDMPVTQFDMKWVETTGLIKFDFLGLKTLTVLAKAVENIKKVHGVEIDISKISLEDKKAYELLCKAETAGVFQLESSGMRDILRKLAPDKMEDIIAIVSLYRPGPMDNIPSYIARKHGEEEPDYLHPLLEDILKETYGIMIYQEQVMQISQVMGGYTLGGADLLRRAMGKKKVEVMVEHRKIFADGAAKNGVAKERADMIFAQMEKFAGYGFNKSHAAAYALIAYQTAYLKAHYPVEFMAAIMTLDLNNTEKLEFFKEETKRMGFEVLQPDVNKSGVYFTVEDGALRYALAAIKNVGADNMKAIVAEREKNGPYKDITDFTRRLDVKQINRRQLENLVKAGAFDSFGVKRAVLFAGVETILQHANASAQQKASSQNSLFGEEELQPTIELPKVKGWSKLEELKLEAEAVGFHLSAHPLDEYRESLKKLRTISSADLKRKVKKGSPSKVKMAGVVNAVNKRISKKGSRYAFVELSDPSGAYEVMLFSEVLNSCNELLDKKEPLLLNVNAEVKEEGDEPRLMAVRVKSLDAACSSLTQGVLVGFETLEALEEIKEILQNDGAGKGRVLLKPKLPDWDVEISLNRGYAIRTETLSSLRGITGVTEVTNL
jgi:DNA polymerase-3 subunit alpha